MLYADDTTEIHSNLELLELMLTDIDIEAKLKQWFSSNKLQLNDKKTLKMVFSHRNHDFSNPEKMKLLGIFFDPHLSWEKHIDAISTKISKNIFVLRSLKSFATTEMLICAYHALIISPLSYAITVWDHSSHSKRLFALQRKALRVIFGLSFRQDVRNFFASYKLLTFPNLYILASVLLVNTNRSQLTTGSQVHHHNTRFQSLARLDFLRLSSSRSAANYYGIKFLNKLPDSFKSLPNPTLKKKLKNFLSENPFQSLDEFLNCNIQNLN